MRKLDTNCLDRESLLPEGWVEAPLQNLLVALESGSRPRGGVRGIEDGVVSVGGEHLDDSGGFRFEKIKYVPKEFFEKMTQGKIEHGDILIVKDGATTGKVSLVKPDFPYYPSVVNEHVFVCRLAIELVPDFLYHYLHSEEGQRRILANFRGSAQGGINRSFAPNTLVPIAPVSEQRRIVNRLDQLHEHTGKVRKRLVRAQTIVSRLRQSVVDSASAGLLTGDWRKKHSPAPTSEELVRQCQRRRLGDTSTESEKARLKQMFGSKELEHGPALPLGWAHVTLEKLCSSFDYGTSQKSEKSGRVPVLRMGNIQRGEIDWGKLAYTSDESEITKYRLSPNSVLFNRTNSPELVGKTAIFRGERKAVFAGYLIRIVTERELLDEYLNICMNTTYARQYCLQVKTDGVSQSNINAKKLAKFEIPHCSLAEQAEIVRLVSSLLDRIDLIRRQSHTVENIIGAIEEATCRKAFGGELVQTEAALARAADQGFENAATLLDRIRRQREVSSEVQQKANMSKGRSTSMSRMRINRDKATMSLIDALLAADRKMSPEDLFSMIGCSEDSVDDFHAALREAVRSGKIREDRTDPKQIYLEIVR